MTPPPLKALDRLVEVFESLEIPYAVGGSLASGAWGDPRSTNDVDVLAALGEEHVVRLTSSLSAEI